ncbi:MAG: thioredoxin fold domain-containing protein [Candidatus Marithrix sp.]|nr:thioredoxin fold domain-containing protein [Candidatus Marithrix sp.]
MRIYFLMALLAISSFTLAEDVPKEDASKDKIPAAVINALKTFAKIDISEIKLSSTPIKGIYEALIGSEVIYLSGDGKYLIMGEIRDLSTGKNITDNKLSTLRIEGIKKVNVRDMVVFAPENETKHVVHIFTDVDCPYCSKIHNEVPALNKAGIEVRYLAFPRAGIGSKTYKDMVSVWCAKDRQKAMTDVKAGEEIEKAECNNPVADQYKLGQSIGISGTPALILSDGELVPGYLPAKRLINYLNQKNLPFTAKE